MILRPLFQWRPYSGEGILATVVKISVGIHTGTINGICNKSLQNFRNKMICLNNMPYTSPWSQQYSHVHSPLSKSHWNHHSDKQSYVPLGVPMSLLDPSSFLIADTHIPE